MDYPFLPYSPVEPSPFVCGEMAFWEGREVNPFLPKSAEHMAWQEGWRSAWRTYSVLTTPEEF